METQQENHGDKRDVLLDKTIALLTEVKALAEEKKKAKTLKAEKQQNAQDSSYQVTYSFKV